MQWVIFFEYLLNQLSILWSLSIYLIHPDLSWPLIIIIDTIWCLLVIYVSFLISFNPSLPRLILILFDTVLGFNLEENLIILIWSELDDGSYLLWIFPYISFCCQIASQLLIDPNPSIRSTFQLAINQSWFIVEISCP